MMLIQIAYVIHVSVEQALVHFSPNYTLLLQQSLSKCRFQTVTFFHLYPPLIVAIFFFIYGRFLIYAHNQGISSKRWGRANIIIDVEAATTPHHHLMS